MALSVIPKEVPEIASEIAKVKASATDVNLVSSQKTNLSSSPMEQTKGPMNYEETQTAKTANNTQSTMQCQPQETPPEVDTQSDIIHPPMHSNSAVVGSASLTSTTSESFSSQLKPRLTLSAFRGPAANITQTDPNRCLQQTYDLQRPGCSGVLGHGAFSTVRLAVRKSDSLPVAVKSIAKHEALRSKRLRPGRPLEEWEILRRMKGHPFTIQLLDVFETEDEIQLVLEYCEGGELFNAIQRKRNRSNAMRRGQYTEEQAACIISQILRALVDLHAAGVVHRDVKPENILLSSDDENSVRVKLCDFGMARSLIQQQQQQNSPTRNVQEDSGEQRQGEVSPLTPGRSRSSSSIGGSYYVAPEICYGSTYDTAVDMYSLGATLYIVLCGFPPVFSGPEADHVMFPNSYWKDISEDAKDLVRKMMDPEASTRITAHEALRDRWIWKHRSSISQALSSSKNTRCKLVATHKTHKKTPASLDMLRRRLSKTLPSSCNNKSTKRRSSAEHSLLSPKRQRMSNAGSNDNNSSASSALMALADLYRDVAQSPSAKVISSVVEHAPTTKDVVPFQRSPLPTLSV